jgi:MOSC domain-containing protein YiiM
VDLSPERGLHGDRWEAADEPNPEAQVSLIDRRVAELLVDGDVTRLHVPGDNIVVELALDEASLPVGTRLALGSALLEITPKPHRGCAKFRERLGDDALRWISAPVHPQRRLRGVYARVIAAGTAAVGDRVERAGG